MNHAPDAGLIVHSKTLQHWMIWYWDYLELQYLVLSITAFYTYKLGHTDRKVWFLHLAPRIRTHNRDTTWPSITKMMQQQSNRKDASCINSCTIRNSPFSPKLLFQLITQKSNIEKLFHSHQTLNKQQQFNPIFSNSVFPWNKLLWNLDTQKIYFCLYVLTR